MERKAGRVRPRISAAASGRGCTLIETLVALAILSIISGVLIRVFVNSLRVEDFSRRRDAAVMESEAVLTGSMMGKKPDEVVDELRPRQSPQQFLGVHGWGTARRKPSTAARK